MVATTGGWGLVSATTGPGGRVIADDVVVVSGRVGAERVLQLGDRVAHWLCILGGHDAEPLDLGGRVGMADQQYLVAGVDEPASEPVEHHLRAAIAGRRHR